MNITPYLYVSHGTNPYWNLALEKYAALHAEGKVILFLWQNDDTVVIGKNQNVYSECRTGLLSDGFVARRLSGGGAVYHDAGNLNFSFISDKKVYSRERQTGVILKALSDLNITAFTDGRNDIMINIGEAENGVTRKISGSAYWENKTCAVHHGTLLINTDITRMNALLSVDAGKLGAKGIASVRSRVANLSEAFPESNITVESMKISIISAFEAEYGDYQTLKEPDGDEIERVSDEFSSRNFIFGRLSAHTNSVSKRFRYGQLRIDYSSKNGVITEAQVYSDALKPSDCEFIGSVPQILQGVYLNPETIKIALEADDKKCGDAHGELVNDIYGLFLDTL